MNFKLHYIFLFLAAGWLLAACSSDEPAEVEPGADAEVTFVVSDLSRASVTSDINFDGSQFAIYGDMKFKDHDLIKVFDNTVVKYINGKWCYDDLQYWFPQHEHSFIAMHPVAAAGISGTRYSDSRLSFSYTLPDDYQEGSDLIVATHRRKVDANPPSVADPINLKFFHILSRIDFRLKNDGAADIVRVTEIKLEGIDRTGSFTIIPANLSSGSRPTITIFHGRAFQTAEISPRKSKLMSPRTIHFPSSPSTMPCSWCLSLIIMA